MKNDWDQRHPHMKEGSVALIVANSFFILLALAEIIALPVAAIVLLYRWAFA